MPIERRREPGTGIILTILSGTVTDAELLAYYPPHFDEYDPHRSNLEIVDGTAIEDMAVSAQGQIALAGLLAARRDLLRTVRCAMVASSDVVYGMFRMWEAQRDMLGYDLRVFRSMDEARAWLLSPR